jgi:hypothetical protein
MKTKLTGVPVREFLATVPDAQMRKDCQQLVRLMEGATGAKARMWGNIVGFGSRKLRYSNGKEVDWMVIAFAPRARTIALYLGADEKTFAELKDTLGKHTGGGTSCLHIRTLDDLHLPTLKKLLAASVECLTREQVLPAKC